MAAKEKIKLSDHFETKDNCGMAKGFVVGRNKDGKIVFKKENMIVLGGRALLLRRILAGTPENPFNNIYPFFGNSDALTRPGMNTSNKAEFDNTFGTISSADAFVRANPELNNEDLEGLSNMLQVEIGIRKLSRNNQMGIRCMGMIYMEPLNMGEYPGGSALPKPGTAAYKGLIFKKVGDTTYNGSSYPILAPDTTGIAEEGTKYYFGTLFSRVTFPPYPDSAELDIEYTYYF